MDERNESDRVDEVMLPGFRFHPTDEELVGFYLKRKVQDKPLSVELIKQLDIYKYDPWDLPKLAATGEKEWYFYCPRDRKYRNSMRPNRVTTGGFWKATGTDRPVYSSEGTKCIGLKKSLVFYKGRAARGTKTDWMMHEFRLLPLTDPSLPKRPFDHKTIPPNESWTICKVFKKTNSMAQRAQSQSWVSSLPEARSIDMFPVLHSAPTIQFGCSNDMKQRPNNGNNCKPCLLPIMEVPCNFMFSPAEMPANASEISMLRNLTPTIHGAMEKASTSIAFEQPQQYNGFTANACDVSDDQWGAEQEANFPLNLLPNLSNGWKPNLPWDPAPSPSEMSTSYSTNECYT